MKFLFLLCALLLTAGSAVAEETNIWAKDNWQIRGRIIGVVPDDDSTVNIGGQVDFEDAVVPELDISYFLTQKIALELILATSSHEAHYNGNTKLGDAWILPPTLTLQYHPWRGESDFSPYVGAGLNYSFFYGEDAAAGFTDLDMEGGLGYALQAGADYWLDEHWGLNVDVKKIWLDIESKLNNGAIRADTDLDPWVIGAGVSYRF